MSPFSLSFSTFIGSSHMLHIPSFLAPIQMMLPELSSPHGALSQPEAEGFIVPGLHTKPLPAMHAEVENYWRYSRLILKSAI
ncbi:MAG: hypothetical protein C4B58_16170 [Deltaproteobacteria bacterium]|nr:MAG: hypothetical protein C4B58_16170 [Deltaproteobacteria bacterium]